MTRWDAGRGVGRAVAVLVSCAIVAGVGLFGTAVVAGAVTGAGVAQAIDAHMTPTAGRPGLAALGRTATFVWPLAGHPTVVTPFHPPPEPWLPGHRGVDLAARPGEAVLAAGAGTVHFAGLVAGVGVVSVDHANGLRTTYEPVDPLVHQGQTVSSGSAIARVVAGHPGCSRATCLHWGLRRGGVYLDPLSLLGLAPVRLYPLKPVSALPAKAGW